jgi:hypothetical protein
MDVAKYENFYYHESHEEYGRVHKGLLTTKLTKDSDISNYKLRVLRAFVVKNVFSFLVAAEPREGLREVYSSRTHR